MKTQVIPNCVAGKAENAGRGETLNGVVETIREEEEEEEVVVEQNGHVGNGV